MIKTKLEAKMSLINIPQVPPWLQRYEAFVILGKSISSAFFTFYDAQISCDVKKAKIIKEKFGGDVCLSTWFVVDLDYAYHQTPIKSTQTSKHETSLKNSTKAKFEGLVERTHHKGHKKSCFECRSNFRPSLWNHKSTKRTLEEIKGHASVFHVSIVM